jgi:hypothetical protein
MLSSGCYRYGSIHRNQLPELSGVRPGQRALIDRWPGYDTADDALGEPTVAGSRYRSLYFDEVTITLTGNRTLKLTPPFESAIWPHPYGYVLTVDHGTGPRSFWLSEIQSVQLAKYDPARAAVVASAALVGAALGFALDVYRASAPSETGDDNFAEPLPLVFLGTAAGAGIGLAISIPLTSGM